MQRDPNIRALTDCGLQCMQATNGHHRRWALKRCTDALVAAGTPPNIATRSALAMAAVGARLADMATDAALGWKPPGADRVTHVVQSFQIGTGVTRADVEQSMAQARARAAGACA